jgi:hypothetical protein
VLAGLAGLLTGVGGMTRYSFGWLIIPVLLFLVLVAGRQRATLGMTALFAFLAVMAPWVYRNMTLSGLPFGTATYAILERTSLFPADHLQRSLEPDFSRLPMSLFTQKLLANLRPILQNELPRFGGTWASAFFLVGLMVGFHHPARRRLRYFLLMCLPVLLLAQALGRTQLWDDSPELNSENLLILMLPLVLAFGVSFFYQLLDLLELPFRELRYAIIGGFGTLACLPMLMIFLPPKITPVVYPPYHPQAIQTIASWVKPDELSMCDIPWAMAWYGHRQAVWLTLRVLADPKDPNTHEDFFAINDYQKPIVALYLTPATMDSKFLTDWIQAGDLSWGSFILESLVRKEIPPVFPLRKVPGGWLPSQLVLTDWERWRKPSP